MLRSTVLKLIVFQKARHTLSKILCQQAEDVALVESYDKLKSEGKALPCLGLVVYRQTLGSSHLCKVEREDQTPVNWPLLSHKLGTRLDHAILDCSFNSRLSVSRYLVVYDIMSHISAKHHKCAAAALHF